MKLEVGMYVRFKDKRGIEYIRKIVEIPQDNRYASLYLDKDANYSKGLSLKNVIKASYNIIDILEVGDIISYSDEKHEILLIDDELMVRNTGLIYDNNYYLPIKSIAIKSVITHEQMEQMAYKVGE